jgi:tight adherence protein C
VIGFLIFGLFFVAVCVAILVRTLTASRARAVERVSAIESYGFASDQAFANTVAVDVPAGMSDLADRIGEMVVRRFGRVSEADLRAELMAAGLYRVSPRALLGYRVLAAVLLPTLIILIVGGGAVAIVLGLAAVAGGWLLPLVIVRRLARLRLERIDNALPDLIDLLVVTVEAGMSFSGSLQLAAKQFTGPLSDELRLTLQEQTMGLAMGDALSHLLGRADTPGMRTFVRSVTQGESLGVSTGQIMRNLSVDMRRRRRKAAEERAQKAPIKLLFPLVFLIFPSIFIVLLLPAVFGIQAAFG